MIWETETSRELGYLLSHLGSRKERGMLVRGKGVSWLQGGEELYIAELFFIVITIIIIYPLGYYSCGESYLTLESVTCC